MQTCFYVWMWLIKFWLWFSACEVCCSSSISVRVTESAWNMSNRVVSLSDLTRCWLTETWSRSCSADKVCRMWCQNSVFKLLFSRSSCLLFSTWLCFCLPFCYLHVIYPLFSLHTHFSVFYFLFILTPLQCSTLVCLPAALVPGTEHQGGHLSHNVPDLICGFKNWGHEE